MTMATIVNNITSLLASLLSWIPDVFEVMVGSPVIMIFLCLAIIGAVVAFARKILM